MSKFIFDTTLDLDGELSKMYVNTTRLVERVQLIGLMV
jgi:hypothetical protein